ncbi:hypothetical protein QAD02_007856 [Eretmocerus hayati]|uniref:Uncharacterized protein n=1 Tax=Eretmocerus hayati TaxID=131215 RepID=A0ACC2N565_9HYME|nr:hypothetical protein QAD02_007856 [Eretmocerus hayati]
MWCLIRALPLLLREKVDEDDDHVELIILLLRVMEIVFAPKLPPPISPYQEDLYQEFLLQFQTLFEDINFINKLHHGQHTRACIEWSGPLEAFDCAAFERKHEELKMRARTVHNFKNPPKTLVRVSQCIQSSRWSSGKVGTDKIEVLNGQTNEIFCATSIKINGVEFRRNLFIVLEKAEARDDNLLGFGKIEEIVMIGIDNIFSPTSVCQTLFLDTSLNAYKIELRDVRDTECVDGKTFLMLDMADMRAMSILMGPAKELLKIIGNLKNQLIELLPSKAYDVSHSNSSPSSSTEESSIASGSNADESSKVDDRQLTLNWCKFIVKCEFLLSQLLAKHSTCSIKYGYPPDEAKQALAEALIEEFPFLKDPRRPLGYERCYDPETKEGFFHCRLQTLQRKAPPELRQYNKKSKPISKDAVLKSEIGILLSKDELNGVIPLLKRKKQDAANRQSIKEDHRDTFPKGRSWIIEKTPTAAQVLQKYP